MSEKKQLKTQHGEAYAILKSLVLTKHTIPRRYGQTDRRFAMALAIPRSA